MRRDRIRVRDVVTILSYVVALTGFISISRYIHIAYLISFIGLLSLSIIFERKDYFPPRWLLNLLSLFVISVAVFRIDNDNLVTTAVETLLILSGIKLLEDKKPRDHLQIYIISIFLISGSALLTLDISFLLYFAVYTFIFSAGVIMLTYHSEYSLEAGKGKDLLDISVIKKIILRSLLLPFIAVPMTAFFFIFLPRTSYPFLNFLNREVSRSGFSETVRLGNVSDIQEDASTVFRAKMERIGDERLYWRGIVFDYFDGLSWKKKEEDKGNAPSIKGRVIKQTIYLEPYDNRYLFALDKPVYMNIRKALYGEGITFALQENIKKRIKYEASSIDTDLIPETTIDRERYLQLPLKGMEDIKALALRLNKQDDIETAVAIMEYLKRGYTYSLKDLSISDNPLRDFLFNRRAGNCEYFASSMAVLLRLNNIPSRVVGGYRGGHYNEMGGYYLVSQRNAHVWVEAYINGKGWLRFDPTPQSPEGIGKGSGIILKTRLILDTINYYWNAFVITYDLSKQITLLNNIRKIKRPSIDFKVKKEGLIRYLASFSAIISVVFMLRFIIHWLKTSREKRLLLRFLRAMKRHGYSKGDYQGLEEFVSGIKEPDLREKASSFVRDIEPYIYGQKRRGRTFLAALLSHDSMDRDVRDRLRKTIKDIK